MWGDNLSRGVLCVDTGQLLIVCVRTVKPVPQRCPCSIYMFVRLSGEAHDTEQSRAMISSDNQQEVLNGFSMNHSWTPPTESYVHHRWQADLEPLHDLCTVVFHICYSAHGCPCWQQNLSTSDRSWTTSLKLRHAVRSLPANADQLWMMAMTLETMAQQNGADVLM